MSMKTIKIQFGVGMAIVDRIEDAWLTGYSFGLTIIS